jgi:hypothetical protein
MSEEVTAIPLEERDGSSRSGEMGADGESMRRARQKGKKGTERRHQCVELVLGIGRW